MHRVGHVLARAEGAVSRDEQMHFRGRLGVGGQLNVHIDPIDQELRHLREPRLGVTHRGRIIAIDVAEIPLPVD